MIWRTRRAFDRCLQLIEEQGYAIPDCLAFYHAQAIELQPLLLLAARIKTAEVVRPDPRAKAEGLIRFYREIDRRLTQRRKIAPARRPLMARPALRGLFTFLIVLLSVAVISSGVVYAAERSTPLSPLYSLKLGYQNLRASVEQNPLRSLQLHLRYIDQRREDILSLLNNNQSSYLKKPLEDLLAHLRRAEKIYAGLSPVEKEKIEAQREILYQKLGELLGILRREGGPELAPLLDQLALLIRAEPVPEEVTPPPQGTPEMEEKSIPPPSLPTSGDTEEEEEGADMEKESTVQPGSEEEREEEEQESPEEDLEEDQEPQEEQESPEEPTEKEEDQEREESNEHESEDIQDSDSGTNTEEERNNENEQESDFHDEKEESSDNDR